MVVDVELMSTGTTAIAQIPNRKLDYTRKSFKSSVQIILKIY
jgi:hypothetical protein